MEKIKKLLDEMEDIKSGKAEKDRMAIVNEIYIKVKVTALAKLLFRSLSRQFLRDEIEAGRIETTHVFMML